MLKFYCEEAGRALAELKSTPDGLTDAEAARRLAEKGPNKLAEGKKVTTLQRFLQQLSDPMIIILLVAAAVSGVTAAYSGESFADVFNHPYRRAHQRRARRVSGEQGGKSH